MLIVVVAADEEPANNRKIRRGSLNLRNRNLNAEAAEKRRGTQRKNDERPLTGMSQDSLRRLLQ
jgi:hypothetical protein